MLNFELFFIILVSYLFGSIPFGLLLTKIFLKKDIREIGSGNIGATNVLRSGNKILGYSTLILDILKAVLPILYIKFFMNDYLYISALSIFIGHVFPIWLKFKGGKGVASYLGILCCLDIFTALIFGIVWISVFILSKFSSLSSLLASLTIPIFHFFSGRVPEKKPEKLEAAPRAALYLGNYQDHVLTTISKKNGKRAKRGLINKPGGRASGAPNPVLPAFFCPFSICLLISSKYCPISFLYIATALNNVHVRLTLIRHSQTCLGI